MIPAKPFDTYSWRWLSVAPTESLLDPPVFLGVLRVFAQHENQSPSSPDIIKDLARVQLETKTSVNLARSSDRNLVRNSGQYWKGTGLLAPERGQIHLTPFGKKVADGSITQGEFAALMVQQTVLPNPWTYTSQEIEKWRAANLEIRPFKLILEVLEELGRTHADTSEIFLTNIELTKVLIPLAGINSSPKLIAEKIILFREGRLEVSDWPNCAPRDNDTRLAREFLLFLSNFGLLQVKEEGIRNEQKFYLNELFDVKSVTQPITSSIFSDNQSTIQAIEEIKHSPLPSIIERQRVLTNILARPGQTQFRSRILKAYHGKCLMTQEIIPEVLEAAHIIPVNQGGSDEANNGFCFRVDIHRLFDSGNIRIKPNGEVVLSEIASASLNYKKLPKYIQFPSFVNTVNISWREKYC